MPGRSIPDIRRELNEAKARVLDLQAELRRATGPERAARDQAIVAAFRGGEAVKEIATRLELTLNTVYGVLDRNDIRPRQTQTPISHLPAEQQRMHDKLRRMGYGPGVARQMAVAS